MRKLVLIALLAALVLGTLAFAAGCSTSGTDIPDPKGLPQETRKVSVFFSSGRSLVEEYRVVNATDVYRATLDELMAGEPRENANIAVVQPSARMRSVTFKKGVVTIDWDRSVLTFDAEPKEKLLAWAAVLRTLGQFPEVQKVAFTVEGKTDGTIGGKKVRSFWGNPSLIGQPWKVLRSANKPTQK